MGINITEIAQKVLDNNTNAANVFRKMYDLHYNPNPLDVPLEYIDENGNKVTTNVPNRSKIKNDFDLWRNSVGLQNVNEIIRGINGEIVLPVIQRDYIYFNDVSFASQDTFTPFTSLNNVSYGNFEVTDNETILFKQKGVYLLELHLLMKSGDTDANVRIGFETGKYTIAQATGDSGWLKAYVSKIQKYDVGNTERIGYWTGKANTWADRNISYLSITRIGGDNV